MTVHKLHGHVEELHIIKVSIMRITVHVMNTPSIRPVLNIKLMLLSIINLMKWKLGNQLGLFCSSASGLMCAPSQPARRASRGPCRRCSSPITPASLAGGASPSPEVYAAPGNAHVFSSVHAHAAGWRGRGFGAG